MLLHYFANYILNTKITFVGYMYTSRFWFSLQTGKTQSSSTRLKFKILAVLASLGCSNRLPKIEALNSKYLFLTVLSAKKVKEQDVSRSQVWWEPAYWFADGHLFFLLYPHMLDIRESTQSSFLLKALISL